jgi:ribosomal 50S subunit-recycling heat shock protein
MRHGLKGQAVNKEDLSGEPRMRLDHFLKISRLVLRRSLAHEICAHGGILINGHVAKAARLVKLGDLLKIQLRGRIAQIRVVKIPETSCTKQEAPTLYEQVESPYVQRFSKQ